MSFSFSAVSPSNLSIKTEFWFPYKQLSPFVCRLTSKEIVAIFAEKNMSKLVSCDFEVYGKVQGVYFRKYTEKQAIILGLRGDGGF